MIGSLNASKHNDLVFMKAVVVKDGAIRFTHKGEDFHITHDGLKQLETMEFLCDTAYNITQAGKLIGKGMRIAY